MGRHAVCGFLPVFLALDLILPFLLAPAYKGYDHWTQVMSVLGCAKAPLHMVYNVWLVVFGAVVLVSAGGLYPAVAKVSGILAAALVFVVAAYAVGGCILSGIFSVGEGKSLDTLPARIHGYGSVLGFSLLVFAPLLVGLYFFKGSYRAWAFASFLCFGLAAVFFALFVMADKPVFRGTAIAREGLWQRLSLLSMYLPLGALCLFPEG